MPAQYVKPYARGAAASQLRDLVMLPWQSALDSPRHSANLCQRVPSALKGRVRRQSTKLLSSVSGMTLSRRQSSSLYVMLTF
jgi:hypothetical protein